MVCTSKSKVIDFTGQAFYIGIDTHRRNWKVTIRLNHSELRTFSMNPTPDDLCKYMRKHYPEGEYNSVYEAGFCGYWIHRELQSLGISNIIVNPADVPTTHKEKSEKRDPIDSRKLARELENGSLTGIHILTERQQSLRSLSRLRFQLVKRRIQIKNRIKGFLHFYGIKIPEIDELSHWSSAFIHWLKSIEFEEPLDRETFDFHIKELEYQRKNMLAVLRRIRKEFETNWILRRIRTVPGISFITAFTTYAELIDINRFKKLDDVASFVGLVPSVSSSGEKETIKGVTYRHCKHLRYLLIEAAWRSVRRDPALTMCYNQLMRRTSKQKAIIRIAKKLLNRIRYVWKNETNYVCAVVE